MKWPIPLPQDSIDAYAWYGNWPHWPVPDNDEQALLAQMDRLAIRAAAVLPLAGVFRDAADGNAGLAQMVRRHPGRLIGIATYDPRQSAPRPLLERAREAGLRGLALFPGDHGYDLGDEPGVEEALRIAGEWGWPVIIPVRLMMSWWLPVTPAPSIMAAARRHPETSVVVASANYGEFEQMLRGLAGLSNVYAEISGLQRLDAVPLLCEAGLGNRLLFGSGQMLQMPECNLVKLAYPALPADVKRGILAGNAARLFGL